MDRILACDLDGVIFSFNNCYAELFKQKFGLSYPPETKEYPSVWNWEYPQCTKAQEDEVWKHINGVGNYQFWRFLPAYPDAKHFLNMAQQEFKQIYFVTARSGKECKRATIDALEMLGVKNPFVIIAHNKVPTLLSIAATDFLDDRDKNFMDILKWNAEHPLDEFTGKLWMLDRPWNRHFNDPKVTRIQAAAEIL